MGVISTVGLFMIMGLVVYIALRIYISQQLQTQAFIQNMQEEVNTMLVEMNRTTERNVHIIENAIHNMKNSMNEYENRYYTHKKTTQAHAISPVVSQENNDSVQFMQSSYGYSDNNKFDRASYTSDNDSVDFDRVAQYRQYRLQHNNESESLSVAIKERLVNSSDYVIDYNTNSASTATTEQLKKNSVFYAESAEDDTTLVSDEVLHIEKDMDIYDSISDDNTVYAQSETYKSAITDDIRSEIKQLYQQGFSPVIIAKRVHISLGEVELLVSLLDA